MADTTINNLPVMQATLVQPYVGAWSADVVVDTDQPIMGAQALVLLGQPYGGTVWTDPADQRIASGLYGGLVSARIVGGAGGLGKPMTAIAYDHGATVAQVLGGAGATTDGLLDIAGERLSLTIDPALLGRFLQQWAWTPDPVDGQLGLLAEFLGVLWRVLPDGTVWLGLDAGTKVPETDFILSDVEPQEGRMTIVAELCTWQPGQTVEGLPIKQVQHEITGAAARTVVTCKPGPANGLLTLLWRFLRRAGWAWSRLQPGVVAAQNADGTLQVQIDGGQYAPLRRVAIDTGLPDTRVQVQPGSRVLVGWRTGYPTQPVVIAWGQSTAISINLAASQGSDAMLKGTTYRTAEASMNSSLQTHILAAAFALNAAGVDVTFAAAFPAAAASLVTAATGLVNAASDINTFEAGAATYLSQVSKTG